MLLRQPNCGKASDQISLYLNHSAKTTESPTTQETLISSNQMMSPSHIFPVGGYYPYLSTEPPLPGNLSLGRVQVPAIYLQIKLRVVDQHGKSEDLEKCTQIRLDSPRGWTCAKGLCVYQGLIPPRVQAEERSPFIHSMYSFKSTIHSLYPLLSSPSSACKCPQSLAAKAKSVLAEKNTRCLFI